MSKQKTTPPPKKIPKHQPQDKQETIKTPQNKIKFKKLNQTNNNNKNLQEYLLTPKFITISSISLTLF